MGIRIRPLEIEIPPDNPFDQDLLARRESVEVLTRIVRSIEGPCALSLDGPWGSGKTTFLNIWDQYLRNNKFPVVKFNVWENDSSNASPFASLSSELTDKLTKHSDGPLREKFERLLGRVTDLALTAAPIVLKSAGNVVPVVGGQLGEAVGSYAKDSIKRYKATQQSVGEFRAALRSMAKKSKEATKRPMIVMIDELDRCRPTYAIELLEVAKHLFSVDHIVFVLAINRTEIAHSIQAIYGDRFDAEGYLRRFFDIDFQLPEPDRDAFLDAMFAAIDFESYVRQAQDKIAQKNAKTVIGLVKTFFRATDMSIRRVSQAIHRLGLVYASLRSDQKSFMIGGAVALILRTIDPNTYHRFLRGELSDIQVVDAVFDRPSIHDIQNKHDSNVFEAAIIVADHEDELYSLTPSEPFDSPLLQRYIAIDKKPENETTPQDRERARNVIWLFKGFREGLFFERGIGFEHSVRRLELLSADLLDDSHRAEVE